MSYVGVCCCVPGTLVMSFSDPFYFLTWPPIPQSFNHDDGVLIGHDESLTKILLQFRSADIKADPQFDAPFAHLKNTSTAMLFRLLLTLASLCFPDMCTEVNCGISFKYSGTDWKLSGSQEGKGWRGKWEMHSCPSQSECGCLPNHFDRGLV